MKLIIDSNKVVLKRRLMKKPCTKDVQLFNHSKVNLSISTSIISVLMVNNLDKWSTQFLKFELTDKIAIKM